MRLRPEQIHRHLEQGLKPLYVVTGDEPLTVLECAQAIREAARAAGVDERLVFDVDRKFDWGALAATGASPSLFATRRLLDVRIPNGKPGREGGATLSAMAAESADGGDVLLLTLPKLERATQGSAWFKALDRTGVVIPCWPVGAGELPGWLDRRMRARGLEPDPAAVRALAGRIEGNLLAAAQEIELIALLCGPGPVGASEVEELVADSARFDVFRLVDAALGGDAARALRIARSLRAEGAPEPIVAWALTRDVRLLYQLREALATGANQQALLRKHQVWDSRKPLLDRAMRRLPLPAWRRALAACARLDRTIKGLGRGDPWAEIEGIVVLLATAEMRLTRAG